MKAKHKLRERLKRRDGERCCYCYRHMVFRVDFSSKMATVEHIVRRADGGSNLMQNLKLACLACNTARGARTFEEWRSIRSRLFTPSSYGKRRVYDFRDKRRNESYVGSFV